MEEKEYELARLSAFTNDLTKEQFQALLRHLLETKCILSGNIKFWRINAGLPVDNNV